MKFLIRIEAEKFLFLIVRAGGYVHGIVHLSLDQRWSNVGLRRAMCRADRVTTRVSDTFSSAALLSPDRAWSLCWNILEPLVDCEPLACLAVSLVELCSLSIDGLPGRHGGRSGRKGVVPRRVVA